MDLYGEFEWRGLVYDATEGVRDVLARETGHRLHRLRSDCAESARRHRCS